MSIHGYIFFSGGRCAEAFEHYREVFGGELSIMRMKDVPEDQRMPGADGDSVMHAALVFGDSLLMGSDDPSGDGGPMTGVSLSFTAADAAAAKRAFDALSAGGEVQMPLEPSFWSEAFGACLDRFGVPWMIDVAEAPTPD